MAALDAEDLVDRIYEAAAAPDHWPDLFHQISTQHDFVGASMFSINPQFQRGVASPGVEQLLADYFAGGWPERNLRPVRAAARNFPGFERDEDLLTDEEIATDPIYVELLRPRGFGWCAGSLINCPNGDLVAISFERAGRLGSTPIEILQRLDLLRPHLARAALMSARLDLERSQAQVAALEALGLPALVLGSNRRALAANALFDGVAGQVRIGARDAVSMIDDGAEAVFSEALGRRGAAAGRSIPLKGADERPAMVLHVLPVRRAARDVFSQAAWLLVATPLGASHAPSASILSGLFDLTPAEARVARAVVEGRAVAEIAADVGVSEATVRTQLREVFAKTGTSRQSELVSACGGLGASPG